MRIKSQKDFLAGLMFTAVGIAFAVGATSYTVGSSARMGPGYFPLLLGGLLGVLGLVVVGGSLTAHAPAGGDPVGRIAWKPLVYVIGANLIFGLLLGGLPTFGVPALGLIAAIFAVVVVSSLAGTQFSLRASLLLAAILAVGSYLTFILGLRLQFQVWPSFITG